MECQSGLYTTISIIYKDICVDVLTVKEMTQHRILIQHNLKCDFVSFKSSPKIFI